MRKVIVAIAVVCLSWPAAALEAKGSPDVACSERPEILGVSRIVEIDTTGGPLLGQQQYDEFDFLDDGEVVLTFDDGPLRRYTQPVLDALDAHCTRATFFVVGRMAVADPMMVRDMARRGHTIGTHTWSHRNLRALGGAAAEKEFELGVSAVSKALGGPVAPFFRFPYLADSKGMIRHLSDRAFGVFSIELDTKDFRTRSPAAVKQRVLSALERQKKGIILFHDIQPSTAGALKGLLDELNKRGFKIVHVVAKEPARTIPEWDEIAGKEFERRQARAQEALADRSAVWPISGSAPRQALSKEDAARVLSASSEDETGPGESEPRRRRKDRPSPARHDDPDWNTKLLGN